MSQRQSTPILNADRLQDTIHVWHYALDPDASTVAACFSLLDADERARAQRFHFEKHRRRFIVARATLRTLLARYADCAPETLAFAYGEHGKPRLAGPCATLNLKFSATHSEDRGAVAVTLHTELGLDIEHIGRGSDYALIAAREFSAEESARVGAAPEGERAAVFLDIWTCKEAYLKGLGVGLSAPLNRFSFAPDAAGQLQLRGSDIDPGDMRRWRFHRIDVGPGFVGCLAVGGEGHRIRIAPWPD